MRTLALALLAALAPAASGQTPEPMGPPVPGVGLSDSARVSLLTMRPGDEVYSLWGHNALRISDPAAGIDRTYNYGTFSFDQPNFLLRFLAGRLDYILDVGPYDLEIQKYAYLGRPVIEQTLDLPPATARALYDLLETNALPQNRAYRYDFLRDNCSTRLLDVLDAALVATGRPAVSLPPMGEPQTFRDLVRPYSLGHPAVDLGTQLGLGLPMDQTAERREAIFLPDALMAALDGATVGGRPLVARRDTVVRVPEPPIDPAFPWPVAAAWALLAVGAVGTWRGRSAPAGRWADAALVGVAGAVGLVLLLMWVATDHDVTAANVELLWLWPTHLAASVVFARGALGPFWRRYALVAAGATVVALALWPVWPEPMHPALLPVGLLLALRLGRRSGWRRGDPY